MLKGAGVVIIMPDGSVIYFSPGDDAQSAILAELTRAEQQIRLAMYALTSVPLVDALIDAQRRGLDVRLILDRSQAAIRASVLGVATGAFGAAVPAFADISLGGSTEAAQLQRLRAAGVPFVDGNSAAGGIIHSKYAVLDSSVTIWGSYNWTLAAARQCNQTMICRLPVVAEAYLAEWNVNWNRLQRTEAP